MNRFLAGLIAFLFAGVAAAQTTSPYASTFTSVTTTFNQVLSLGITLLALVVAGFVGMKIAKRIINKAT